VRSLNKIYPLILSINEQYKLRRLGNRYRDKVRKMDRLLTGKGVKGLTPSQKREVDNYWKRFGLKVDMNCHRVLTAVYGEFDVRYIPEDLFFTRIERGGIDHSMLRVYVDKNNYKKLYPKVKTPDIVLKAENGFFTNEEGEILTERKAIEYILSGEGRFILKPSLLSGGGKRIETFEIHNSIFKSTKKDDIGELLERSGKNFVIERMMEQYPEMGKFHPSSVNTVRTMTMWDGNDTRALSSFMRFGNNGSYVDNFSSGGMICGIDKMGRLRRSAKDMDMNSYEVHPQTKERFAGFDVPRFGDIIEKARELHREMKYFSFASWDFAIDRDQNIIMIEVNLDGQGLFPHQMVNGPLFGEHTERILSSILNTDE